MDKQIQAVDIAAVVSGSKGKPESSAEKGESVPFAEVLSPASEDMADTGTGADNTQVAEEGGNALPVEQEMPATAVAGEAGQALQLPTLPGSTENVDEGLLPVPEEPRQVSEQPATVLTDPATVQAAAGEMPARNDLVDKPVDKTDPKQAPPANSRLQHVVAAPAEVVAVARDSAVSGNRVEPGLAAPVQPQGSTAPGTNGAAADATLAAGRASVQPALAAQVAQDGLRQSMTGGEQNSRPIMSHAVSNMSVEASVASFTTVFADAAGVSGTARVAVPVGEAGWARAVGEQVVWHVSQNIQAANLRLNPQHLGPLEMQVHVEGDKATVVFASQHAAVREALESALPRLRDMFSQNGMNIVDVNVSQQDTSGHQGQQVAASGGSQSSGDDGIMMDDEQSGSIVGGMQVTTGLVDYYI